MTFIKLLSRNRKKLFFSSSFLCFVSRAAKCISETLAGRFFPPASRDFLFLQMALLHPWANKTAFLLFQNHRHTHTSVPTRLFNSIIWYMLEPSDLSIIEPFDWSRSRDYDLSCRWNSISLEAMLCWWSYFTTILGHWNRSINHFPTVY